MNKKVVIVGAGGHGKVVADIVICSGDTVMGFLDDRAAGAVAGIPVLGKLSDWVEYPDCEFVVAVGNSAAREEIAAKMADARWYTAVHPAAVVSELDTAIGVGSVVMANAVVNPGAKIGRHCIINTAAVVEHDNVIEDFAHISVGAKLAGTARIGKGAWVGVGAVVSNNLSVCGDCMIGAGAVVVKNIDEPGVYVGVPAKKIK